MRRYLLIVLLVGCTGTIDGTEDITGPDAETSALTGTGAVARAKQWVAAKLHYCQAPNHAPDADADCSATCVRQDNPEWDPYRSDCSGLVSWAWGLPPPGRNTKLFAPFQTDLTHAIQADDLRSGDAVNNDHHMMLFVEWVTPGTTAMFIDEPGCSSSTPYAREVKVDVTPSGTTLEVRSYGAYTAIRYDDAP